MKIGTGKNAPVSIGRTWIEDALIVLVNQVGDSQVSGNGATPLVAVAVPFRQGRPYVRLDAIRCLH